MAKQIANSKEALELLKTLLSSDQNHRQQLASNLHAKKAIISAVILQLGILHKDLRKGRKIEPGSLEELRTILTEFNDDLRPIHAGMSPPKVYLLGLTRPLNAYFRTIEETFGIETAINCPDLEHIKIPKSAQAGIYRICAAVTELLIEQNGLKRIVINIEKKRNFLDVSIFGYPIRKGSRQRIFMDKNMNLIKALLMWQNAVVNEMTDWNYVFSFRFRIK